MYYVFMKMFVCYVGDENEYGSSASSSSAQSGNVNDTILKTLAAEEQAKKQTEGSGDSGIKQEKPEGSENRAEVNESDLAAVILAKAKAKGKVLKKSNALTLAFRQALRKAPEVKQSTLNALLETFLEKVTEKFVIV